MDSVSTIIKELYNSFLLRDIFGKMVPGLIIIFSFIVLLVKPKDLLYFVCKELSPPMIVFLLGLS